MYILISMSIRISIRFPTYVSISFAIANTPLLFTGDTLFPGLATVILSWVVIVGGGVAMTRLRPDLASTGPWIAATVYIIILGVVVATRFERGGWRRLHLLKGEAENH